LDAALGGELYATDQHHGLEGDAVLAQYYSGTVVLAFEYLHTNHIMYRDLKPENIGFDQNQKLKVFDFGLAKEILPHEHGPYYHHTGFTGPLRYMAPEVARGKAYGTSADLYSFAILLWQIWTLEVPFENYEDEDLFIQDVIIKKKRPKLNNVSCKLIRTIVESCWDENKKKRPSLHVVSVILERQLTLLLSEVEQ